MDLRRVVETVLAEETIRRADVLIDADIELVGLLRDRRIVSEVTGGAGRGGIGQQGRQS